jgi:hypothetical protein
MKPYKTFQFGWPVFIILIPIQLLITILYFTAAGSKPLSQNGFILASFGTAAVTALFYGLTIQVDDQFIRLSFGVGLIRKKIHLSTIKAVDIVDKLHLYGWGIRISPKGFVYNVSGSRGISLTRVSNTNLIRIGTEDPVTLKEQILKRLKTDNIQAG